MVQETKCAWTHARDASLAAAAAAILLSPGQAWADMQVKAGSMGVTIYGAAVPAPAPR